MLKPLDAREWLEAERIAGNDFAGELIELVESEPYHIECASLLDELSEKAPEELRNLPEGELWRLVKWATDRLAILAELEAIVKEFGEGVTAENGTPLEPDEKLRVMLESPRWQRYDL